MKEISTKNIILPLVILLLAVVFISILSVNSIKSSKTACDYLYQEIDACNLALQEKTEDLENTMNTLNITQADVDRYDEIYEEKATEADKLARELEEEKDDGPPIILNVPYRSVATYDAYSIATKIELLLERIDNAEALFNKEFVSDDDYRLIVGYLYINALELRLLFMDGNVENPPLNEDGYRLFKLNKEHIEELDGMYHNFNELQKSKIRTRVGQLILLQRSTFEGMQATYFMRR